MQRPIRPTDYILFVDTETTGIPFDTSVEFKNIDNWPTIRQMAWMVYKKDGSLHSSFNCVTPDNAESEISPGSDYVPKTVLPTHIILDRFLSSLSMCDVIVGHNIEYDIQVILSELHRYGKTTWRLRSMRKFCTMKNSVDICGFATRRGDRYPKLQELYSKLFHQSFENAHDAYCDIRATADCYWKMFNTGLLRWVDYPYLIDTQKKSLLAKEYSEKGEQAFKAAKDKIGRKPIVEEAWDALGLCPLLTPSQENVNRIWDYIRHKYHINAKDEVALDKLLKDDTKAINEEKYHKFDEALSLFKKAADLGDAYSMYRIACIYDDELDDKNNAYEWYSRGTYNGYVSAECYYNYASVSARLHKNDEALGYYAKFAEMCENSFDTISILDLHHYLDILSKGLYGQRKDLPKAIDVCKRALATDNLTLRETTDRLNIQEKLAELYEQNGDTQYAIEVYDIYIHGCKDAQIIYDGELYLKLANLNEQIGDNESAVQYYDIWLQANKSKSWNKKKCLEVAEHLFLYYFNTDSADYAKAKLYIDITLFLDPYNTKAIYYLGKYFEKGLGECCIDLQKAFECYEKAAKYNPDAAKELGIMYLNGTGCKKSKRKARKYLKRAKRSGLNVEQYLNQAKSWYNLF
jgi:DNA polymerase III subunit epsilon